MTTTTTTTTADAAAAKLAAAPASGAPKPDHSVPASGGASKPAVVKVPAPERRGQLAILLMVNPAGLTRDEIAAKLNCSAGVVAYTIKDLKADLKASAYVVAEDSTSKLVTLSPKA
jgi:hypothetical protein